MTSSGARRLVAEAHDRALAELLLDVGERGVEGLLAVSTSHVLILVSRRVSRYIGDARASHRQRLVSAVDCCGEPRSTSCLWTETSPGSNRCSGAGRGVSGSASQSRQNSLPSGSVITMKPALIGGRGLDRGVPASLRARRAARTRPPARPSAPRPRSPGAARTSRCTRFLATLSSGTCWKNSRGPCPSGSSIGRARVALVLAVRRPARGSRPTRPAGRRPRAGRRRAARGGRSRGRRARRSTAPAGRGRRR